MCPEPSGRLRALGEFGIIELFAAVGQGLGDDCAVLDVGGAERLCVSTDMLLEGIHFERGLTSAWRLGWKALAVNLSDLAAMGAKPVACLLAAGWPADLEAAWLLGFRDGLAECAARYACPLVGGDTVRSSGPISLSLTVLGRGRAERLVSRAGAQAGELIFVGGAPGDSAAGLYLLQQGACGLTEQEREELVGAHLQPRPQLTLGLALAQRGLASAMIDLSDGLFQDLGHLARLSGLGAEIEADRLPVSRAARRLAEACGRDVRDWALFGGEDYHLIFSSPAEKKDEVEGLAQEIGGVDPVCVGSITREAGLRIRRDGRWEAPRRGGYDHFSEEATAETEEADVE